MKNNSKSGKPRVGLVGYGYWGPNLLRNLVSQGGCEVIGVVDSNPAAAKKVRDLYPQIPVFDQLSDCLSQQKPDAMVIATPPATHKELAIQCIEANAHVLVEKPLALSVSDCDAILAAAERKKRTVMVDHTFVFHPAVQRISAEVTRGNLGELLYYDSVRVNLGGFQPKTNVLWDLAPHDLSIIDVISGGRTPEKVTCVGVKHFNASVENLCYLNLRYSDNFVANVHLNWVAPMKVRQIMIGGSQKMIIYDDNLPTEKVKIYDKGISLEGDPNNFRVNYRVGDMTAPAISTREALSDMVAHFIDCISNGTRCISDGALGRRTVQILEAASLSLSRDGQVVEIPQTETTQRQRKLKLVA